MKRGGMEPKRAPNIWALFEVAASNAAAPCRSGVQVWYELTFQTGNHVLQPEFLLLQASNSQLIDMGDTCQFGNGHIEAPMCHSELF